MAKPLEFAHDGLRRGSPDKVAPMDPVFDALADEGPAVRDKTAASIDKLTEAREEREYGARNRKGGRSWKERTGLTQWLLVWRVVKCCKSGS